MPGGYRAIVWAILRVSENPEVLARVRAAVAALPDEPSARDYMENETLLNVMLETKRTTPLLPFVVGRALKDFEVCGYKVPGGWPVYWSVHGSNNHEKATSFTNPGSFD